MSEENNQTTDKESKQPQLTKEVPDNVLKIELDTNKQVERLQEQLEQKTAKIAVMEYEKNNRFGLPNPPKGGDTAPLNPADDFKPSNNNGSLMTKEYANEFELYSDLAKRSAEGDVESQAIQRQILKKLRNDCGGLIDVEFYGDTHALYRQPKPITPDMTPEIREYIKQKNAELMLEKSKWRKVQ